MEIQSRMENLEARLMLPQQHAAASLMLPPPPVITEMNKKTLPLLLDADHLEIISYFCLVRIIANQSCLRTFKTIFIDSYKQDC